MPNYLSILRSHSLFNSLSKNRYRNKKVDSKVLYIIVMTGLLSAFLEQPSASSSPLLIESGAHYTITTPTNDRATGASESTIIERHANLPKPSVNREDDEANSSVDPTDFDLTDSSEKIVDPIATPSAQTELVEPE